MRWLIVATNDYGFRHVAARFPFRWYARRFCRLLNEESDGSLVFHVEDSRRD